MRFPRVGEEFEGRYHLERVLGEGGFARVFEATENSLGRLVALKVLKPQADGYSAGIRARFDQEVRVIANLSDPHSVTVYDWGQTDDGLLYMAFEYVAGEDLVEILDREGQLDEASTIRILRQILMSLREAHDHDLLHRDIKPHNVRVYEYAGDPLCAKLLDFGIAKPITGGAAITTEGAIVGSPRYMAPEHLLNQPLGPASDLYSLGLVTYEMLLGRDARKGSHLYDQLDRMKSQEALSIPDGAPISPRMRHVLRKLLAFDPAKRFQSADQVLAALDGTDVAKTAPDPTFEDPPTQRMPPRPQPRLPRTQRLPQHKPHEPRATPPAKPSPAASPIMGVLLGLVVLAALGGVAMWLTADDPARESPITPPPVSTTKTPTRATADEPPAVIPVVAPGCGVEPPFRGPGTMSALDLFHQTSWGAYIPRSYDPERPHQVLMLFHEDLDAFTKTLRMSGFEAYAEARNIVILLPLDPAVRAWRGMTEVRRAARVLELANTSLCLDTSQGVLAFGHGTGGRAAERLTCVMTVRALAASAHRPEVAESFCEPSNAVPYLHIAPLADGYDPLDGTGGCGATKLSLEEFEERWRERNRCDPVKTLEKQPGGRCFSWACEVPFVSCHAPGGHRWPGQDARAADVQDCDGGSMSMPIAEVVWDFFDRYLVETQIEP